jgi:prepilin-type processing-associated H-X9-DG protein
MMYESDNNGGFPSPCSGWGAGGGETQWCDSIMPYLKNSQILIDPSAATTPTMGDGTTKSNYIGQWEAGLGNSTPPDPGRIDYVPFAAQMFDLICSNATPGWMGTNPGTNYLAVGGYGNYQECAFLHNQGANVGFADGHAAWMSQAVVLAMPRPWGVSNNSGAIPRFWWGNDIATWPNWVPNT